MGLLSLYLYCFIMLESSNIFCTIVFRRLVCSTLTIRLKCKEGNTQKHILLAWSFRSQTASPFTRTESGPWRGSVSVTGHSQSPLTVDLAVLFNWVTKGWPRQITEEHKTNWVSLNGREKKSCKCFSHLLFAVFLYSSDYSSQAR